jgi:hypothetical protein
LLAQQCSNAAMKLAQQLRSFIAALQPKMRSNDLV